MTAASLPAAVCVQAGAGKAWQCLRSFANAALRWTATGILNIVGVRG